MEFIIGGFNPQLYQGHWLDDSRLVSSYNLQPHCLLELQLRNNYIQLPPPGTNLTYYDHYAEGVLYKKSKKGHRVTTKLTSHAIKDSAGVWKERWVVLQGTKLFIYHKGKSTTKKAIELQTPLNVVTTVIPQAPRQSFKPISSTVPMSMAMITLTISPDSSVCFRATSESELNHWVRIFNSLNCSTLQGVPSPFDLTTMSSPIVPPMYVPPPLPPLPLEPPPVSVDNAAMSTKKRDRHHSFTAAATYGRVAVIGFGGIATAAATATIAAIGAGGFSGGRKRCHTAQGNFAGVVVVPPPSLPPLPPPTAIPGFMPTINPVLISNAAIALSNLQSSENGSEAGGSDIGSGNSSALCSRSNSLSKRRGNYGQQPSGMTTPLMRSASLRKSHLRNSTDSQSTPMGALLGGTTDLCLQHHALSRQTSSSSLEIGQGQGSGSESGYGSGYGFLSHQNSFDDGLLMTRQNVRSMRMRTVTEPGQGFGKFSGFGGQGGRVRSMGSQRSSSQSLLKEYIQRSK
ncbi:hypothetical protein BGZ65_005572, partial [Modicella reniformis]